MARVTNKRKTEVRTTALEIMMREHLQAMRVRNYSEQTVHTREFHLSFFIQWCQERGIEAPVEVTRPVIERYQRHLFHYRKKNGQPLTFRSQHSRLSPLRMWFRWMTRQNHILHNPASELELPRLGRVLPKNILSADEVEKILLLPDIHDPIGLRDRAIMEVLYSTGIRRMEIIGLKLYHLSLDRGVVFIQQGKGKKDRYVPIGERAAAWLELYIAEARPRLALEPDDLTVFLTAQGEPFNRDHMTSTVKERIDAAKLGKTGACHLFRHTMATLMHENGADIRFIQEMLGHARLETTQIYTQVSIRTLQQVHTATHPSATLEHHAAPEALPMIAPEAQPGDPTTEDLFAALDAESEEDEEDKEQ
jgi:integrase/recombinase XerD